MIHQAVKDYLYKSVITGSEIELIKELLKDGEETLKDFIPTDKKLSTRFLSNILSASLKDHKNNQDFIKNILDLKNEDNKDSFYYHLSNNKYGLKIIKANPTLFNDNIDKSFADILNKGSAKSILEFVKANKEKIKIETVYKSNLDIKTVQAIEKEGFSFDQRILNVILCKSNLKKPADLLKHMEKIEPKCEGKVWNDSIIRMLNYYSHELWDWNGTNRFGDSFCLITKLKNPSQYKWGQEFSFSSSFTFSNSLSAYFDEKYRYGYPSITGGEPIDISVMKDFFKSNDIHFDNWWSSSILYNFSEELSDSVINSAIQSNWERLFRFKKSEYDKHGHYRKDIIFDSLYNEKENPLLKEERIVKAILKEYFAQPKYRFDEYDTGRFFELLGLDLDTITKKKVLFKYTDILFQENVQHICEALKMKVSVAEKIAAEFQVEVLNKELKINDVNSNKKPFKI
jgi:hypothetical protein